MKNGYNPQELLLFPQKEDKSPQPVLAETIKEVTIESEGTRLKLGNALLSIYI